MNTIYVTLSMSVEHLAVDMVNTSYSVEVRSSSTGWPPKPKCPTGQTAYYNAFKGVWTCKPTKNTKSDSYLIGN